jgi:hypothetical protein
MLSNEFNMRSRSLLQFVSLTETSRLAAKLARLGVVVVARGGRADLVPCRMRLSNKNRRYLSTQG